ncbi:MAG: peptidoglycan DD-metalloendopeptidase family protein [Luteibacter sp.]|uniref:murein hydrolase activator EnvC family protein n=1 Tax=Luteibacter TaxID=242605 RepID=UPI000563980D|nr:MULTISPECIES: peptidoglycan DD-metalloendopeptidase family protein [unclassified Luteibacter]MDQ7997434.1 peptidoglycan DD-metalloendopeptidase family protein [Luteibacter sp.]MDQ8048364.1 peptidoglycan DD-metalloendopeptidase family protein [Luteibacter sp.]MDR6643701.1 septal ring factor EnvC (AmiA/AmiB activator) [Luteibacter sp. 1214]SKB37254.1 Septal ring factor EnvC, activator of murein hydrolases AmiA and AmiB [Luteibacter sp. 22Crub2.1]
MRPTFRLPLALTLAIATLTPLLPAHAAQDGKTRSQQDEARQKLEGVRKDIDNLTKEQRETANARDSANAALAKQAEQVSAAARAVRETDGDLQQRQHDLEQLNAQRAQMEAGLSKQKDALGDLLRATYTLGRGSDLQLLLGDEDVNRISRALAYSKYFQDNRVEKIRGLLADLSRLQEVEAAITAEQQKLEATRAERESRAAELEKQRASQAKLVAEADSKYKDQAQRMAALKQNEQDMNSLVGRLQKVIDDAAKAEAARAAVEAAPAPKGTPAAAPVGNMRGNLPWPANGPVHAFGSGVIIVAPRGSEVKAVARGRVVFANFLRGYGMMIIVNHGNGFMSMYGNNETLLHGVGDTVEAGQAVGTAAAPAGDNGAYFELRQGGKPIDARGWLSKKH